MIAKSVIMKNLCFRLFTVLALFAFYLAPTSQVNAANGGGGGGTGPEFTWVMAFMNCDDGGGTWDTVSYCDGADGNCTSPDPCPC
jgi:hypothetical protein